MATLTPVVPKATLSALGLSEEEKKAQSAQLAGARQAAVSRAQGLTFDKAGVEQSLVNVADQEAQQAREKLARQFGIDPGGALSGTSQNRFENLEGSLINTKANIRAQLAQTEADQARQNVSTLASTVGQFAATDLAASQQDLAAESERLQMELNKAAATGDFQGQQTLAAKLQEANLALEQAKLAETQRQAQFGEGIEARKQSLNEEISRLQQQLEAAKVTGDYQGQQTLEAEIQRRQQTLTEAGLTGTLDGKETLAARELTARLAQMTVDQQLGWEQLALQKEAQELQQRIAYAEQTGDLQGAETLKAQQQRVAQDLEYKNLALRSMELTGTASVSLRDLGIDPSQLNAGSVFNPDGSANFSAFFAWADSNQQIVKTLEAAGVDVSDPQQIIFLMQGGSAATKTLAQKAQDLEAKMAQAAQTGQWDTYQTLAAKKQEADISLAKTSLAMQGSQFITQQTGRIGGASGVTAAQLGVDTSGLKNPDGTTNSDAWMAAQEQVTAALTAMGVTPTQEMIQGLLSGQTTALPSTMTLSAMNQALLASGQISTTQLQAQAQALDAKVQQAAATGNWDEARTLNAQKLDLERTIQTFNEKQSQAQLTGMTQNQVSLASLGLPADANDGTILQKLSQLYGSQMALTSADLRTLRSGGQVLVAAKTIEQKRIDFEKYMADQQNAIQTGNLELAKTSEANRTKEAVASLTGRINQEIDINTFGVTPSTLWDAYGMLRQDAGLTTEEMQRRESLALAPVNNAVRELTGRDMTEAETQALKRGQKIVLGNTKTISQQQSDLEAAIARAGQTGYLADPETGKDIATLQKEKQDFEKQLANDAQKWQQKMDTAAQTGYYVVSDDGKITAKELGVDLTYVMSLPLQDRKKTKEAQMLKDTYQAMVGKPLDEGNLTSLLYGLDAWNPDGEIKIETVAARAQREASQLAWSQAAGKIGAEKTEAARQFDAELSRLQDVDSTQKTAIQAQTALAERELNTKIAEFASTTSMNLLQLTGGGSGEVDAAMMGIPLGDQNMTDVEKRNAIRTGIQSFTGRAANDAEVETVLRGGKLTVTGSQTLAARELAAQVSSQMLQNQATQMKIAGDLKIEQDKVAQYVKESDRNYAQAAKESAQKYGLDLGQFTLARMQVEGALTGYINSTGRISSLDIGVEAPPNFSTMNDAQKAEVKANILAGYRAYTGNPTGELDDATLTNMAMGGTLNVGGRMSTMDKMKYDQSVKEAARNFGLDAQKFLEASEEFDKNWELQDRNSWAQITGTAVGLKGGVGAGTTVNTAEQQQFEYAREVLARADAKSDLVWSEALSRSAGNVQKTIRIPGISRSATTEQNREAMKSALAKTEYSTIVATMPDEQIDYMVTQYMDSNSSLSNHLSTPAKPYIRLPNVSTVLSGVKATDTPEGVAVKIQDFFTRGLSNRIGIQQMSPSAYAGLSQIDKAAAQRNARTLYAGYVGLNNSSLIPESVVDSLITTGNPGFTSDDYVNMATGYLRQLANPTENDTGTFTIKGAGSEEIKWNEITSLMGVISGQASAIAASIKPSTMSQIAGIAGGVAGIAASTATIIR